MDFFFEFYRILYRRDSYCTLEHTVPIRTVHTVPMYRVQVRVPHPIRSLNVHLSHTEAAAGRFSVNRRNPVSQCPSALARSRGAGGAARGARSERGGPAACAPAVRSAYCTLAIRVSRVQDFFRTAISRLRKFSHCSLTTQVVRLISLQDQLSPHMQVTVCAEKISLGRLPNSVDCSDMSLTKTPRNSPPSHILTRLSWL